MGTKRFHQLTIPDTVDRHIILADNDAEGWRARGSAEGPEPITTATSAETRRCMDQTNKGRGRGSVPR